MNEINKTLYKKDSKGKIRSLLITTLDGSLTQTSGLLDGKLVKTTSKRNPKNVGKKNETTAQEQAILEGLSKITKKLKLGYFETIKEAEETEVICHMLAEKYKKQFKKINWAYALSQPKLDGVRLAVHISNKKVSMFTREKSLVLTLGHIIPQIESLELNDCILDGEVYLHGLCFDDISSLFKKYRPGETEKLNFVIYDSIEPTSYVNRLAFIQSIGIEAMLKKAHNIKIIDSYEVTSPEEFMTQHKLNITNGYEGSMLRWGLEDYKMSLSSRSIHLLKLKDFEDIDALIIDILPQDADPLLGKVQCKIVWKSGQEIIFKCGMKVTHEVQAEMLKNKENYIGKIANVRYFELTSKNNLRHPKYIGIHPDR